MSILTHEPFDSCNGPMWRARMIEEDNSSECPLSQLTSEFPKQFEFLIAINHGITDGFSNLKIIEAFLQILDKIIRKIPLDNKQLGVFSAGEQTDVLLQERKQELLLDKEKYTKVTNEVMQGFVGNVNTLWEDSFGINKNFENKTYHLADTLSSSETEKLLEKLKNNRISLNSGFCALFNILLVEMIREKEFTQDSYNIGTLHGVNFRQFWTKDENIHFGMQIGVMRVYVNTPSTSFNFWEYAQEVHRILRTKVNEKWPLNETLVSEEMFKAGINELKDFFNEKAPKHTILYSSSSLGNIDHYIESSGQHVQWSAISRSTSATYLACPISINFQIFRKILSLSVEYYPKYANKELASSIIIRLKEKILKLIEN